MALILDSYAAKLAFFHSFNLANTSGDTLSTGIATSQAIAKSNHSIIGGDVKIENIPFAEDEAEALNNCFEVVSYDESTKKFSVTQGTSDKKILRYYEKVPLTMITGSNKQGYYFAGTEGTGYVDKWISPLDSLQGFNQSGGYTLKLYPVIGGKPQLVDGTAGAYLVSYNNGLICIQSTQVPGKGEAASWTDLRASFFAYIGRTVSDLKSDVSDSLEWGSI